MEMIRLVWSKIKEEGVVRPSKEFKQADSILQIDALGDWIKELEDLREALLAQEHPDVKKVLWGIDG
jgi:hypothetical protein